MIRSIATVFTGTVFAQLLGLAFLPLLTKIYTPEDFGVYQVFVASLRVFLMFSAFRYEVGLLEARDPLKFNALFTACILLTAATSAMAGGGLLVAQDWIAAELSVPHLLIWLFPLLLFVAGVHQVIIYLPIRNRQYTLSSVTKVAQTAAYGGSAFALVFLKSAGLALSVAETFGRLIAVVGIAMKTENLWRGLTQGVSKSEMAAVLKEYKRYPVFTFPGTALSALSAALMTFSFTQLFSVNVAGQYGLVLQFVMAPLGAVAFSVSQVFTGDLSKAISDSPSEAHRIYRRVVRILTIIGVPGAIIGYFAGPWVIRVVFGAQWELAAEFCALSIPMALSTFIAAPINMVLILTRDNKTQIYWEIGRFVTIAAAYLAFRSVLPPDPRLVMGVFSGLTFATYMVYLVIADRALRNLHSRLP